MQAPSVLRRLPYALIPILTLYGLALQGRDSSQAGAAPSPGAERADEVSEEEHEAVGQPVADRRAPRSGVARRQPSEALATARSSLSPDTMELWRAASYGRRFEQERTRAVWADRQRRVIEAELAENPALEALVTEIECRSSLCRLEVSPDAFAAIASGEISLPAFGQLGGRLLDDHDPQGGFAVYVDPQSSRDSENRFGERFVDPEVLVYDEGGEPLAEGLHALELHDAANAGDGSDDAELEETTTL